MLIASETIQGGIVQGYHFPYSSKVKRNGTFQESSKLRVSETVGVGGELGSELVLRKLCLCGLQLWPRL